MSIERPDIEQRRARREDRRTELARRRRRSLLGFAGGLVIAGVLVALVLHHAHKASSGGSTRGHVNASAHSSATSEAKGGGSSALSKAATKGATSPVANGRPGTESVPILMYHVIAAPPPGAPFPGLYVTASEFAGQMEALSHAGFHAVTLDQMRANWREGKPLPAGKPIVISFDNGYESQYTHALPVLERLGWVGDENLQLTGLPPSQGGLSRSQVRGLVTAGWELDTQGFSHADLIALSPSELHYQVAVSRSVIRARYHVAANWFCYPSGHYNAAVIAAVKAAGYVGSTTVVPGWARRSGDPYRLPRLRVLGGTSPEGLLGEISAIRSDAPAPPAYGSS